jgi:hypothetical protein
MDLFPIIICNSNFPRDVLSYSKKVWQNKTLFQMQMSAYKNGQFYADDSSRKLSNI